MPRAGRDDCGRRSPALGVTAAAGEGSDDATMTSRLVRCARRLGGRFESYRTLEREDLRSRHGRAEWLHHYIGDPVGDERRLIPWPR